MTPEELEALTFAHLPEDFARRALMAVFAAHKSAWTHCLNFPEPEAENLIPHERRAKLEANLAAIAGVMPGVRVDAVKSSGAFWNHREARSGVVIVTANSVSKPCGKVRKSRFRETLVRESQLAFPTMEEAIPEDAPLYVQLLHSRYRSTDRDDRAIAGHLPGSAYLVWPTPQMKYAHTLNLFERFPEVVRSQVPNEWNEEAVLRYVGRARRGYGS